MNARDSYEQGADWLVGTVRRNPEALLVLAAGCALLMRSKGAASNNEGPRHEGHPYRPADPAWQYASQGSGTTAGAADSVRSAAARVQDKVQDYAAATTSRVSATAASYAANVSEYAGGVRDAVVSGVSQFPDQARATVQSGFARVLREQPLAIAALGLAAGATLAAIFPASPAESRVLGPAHDAVVDAAARAATNVRAAAGEAGEQLKQAARERGLHPEGLKDLARDVAGNFADHVTRGQSDQTRSEQKQGEQNDDIAPGLVPEATGAGSGR
ncbi:MAG TPA: hypothetical protein VKX28_27345 [Xanthobacteraceae bacterium]|jgi:hypothetical protein|nr:hypothetical protein [Xanthobacteraceae bacterium]